MKAVETKEYISIIEECFSLDEELCKKWHIAAPGTSEECSKKTVDDLNKAHISFKFYKVMLQKKLVGFYGTEEIGNKLYVNTIFIKPKYRNKDLSIKFLKLIPRPFTTYLYAKNERAINWYLKNGGKVKMNFVFNQNPAVEIEVR